MPPANDCRHCVDTVSLHTRYLLLAGDDKYRPFPKAIITSLSMVCVPGCRLLLLYMQTGVPSYCELSHRCRRHFFSSAHVLAWAFNKNNWTFLWTLDCCSNRDIPLNIFTIARRYYYICIEPGRKKKVSVCVKNGDAHPFVYPCSRAPQSSEATQVAWWFVFNVR